jgi:hypothetical protein
MPSRSQFDRAFSVPLSPDQEIIIPSTLEGTYYVLAYGDSGAGAAQPFTIQADILQFGLRSVDLAEIGNTGPVTILIDGSKFDQNTTFSLRDVDGSVFNAAQWKFIDSTQALVTFDLQGADAGLADVLATNGSQTATLDDVTQIQDGAQGNLYVDLQAPSALRVGQTGIWYVNYANTGKTDVDIPLLLFNLPGASYVSTSPSGENFGETLTILGLPDEHLYSSLRPGETVSIPLFAQINSSTTAFLSVADPQDPLYGSIAINYERMQNENLGGVTAGSNDYIT